MNFIILIIIILLVMFFIFYQKREKYFNPYEPLSWGRLTCANHCLGKKFPYECTRDCDRLYVERNNELKFQTGFPESYMLARNYQLS